MGSIKTRQVTRDKLRSFLGDKQELIKLFENLVSDVSEVVPSTLDEVEGTAETGRALAQLGQGIAAAALALAEELVAVPQRAAIVEAFPVGAVFVSTVATDPAQLLGYGVWSAYAAGRALVGFASGDPDFGTPGGTGGAKTTAISAHAGTAVADHPDHTHGVTSNVTSTTSTFQPSGVGTPAVTGITNNPVTSTGASATLSHTVTQPNNHADVSVLQPYITVFLWVRVA